MHTQDSNGSPFLERSFRVMMVARDTRLPEQVCQVLREEKHLAVHREYSAAAARMCLSQLQFDLVFINDPLPDESGAELAEELSGDTSTVVALIVAGDRYEEVFSHASPSGVYVLSRPLPKPILLQAVDWMISTRERLGRLEKRSVSLEERMQSIRSVNRAKWLLISKKGMTEEEAHRFIEKTAMDQGLTKAAVAQRVIDENDN